MTPLPGRNIGEDLDDASYCRVQVGFRGYFHQGTGKQPHPMAFSFARASNIGALELPQPQAAIPSTRPGKTLTLAKIPNTKAQGRFHGLAFPKVINGSGLSSMIAKATLATHNNTKAPWVAIVLPSPQGD